MARRTASPEATDGTKPTAASSRAPRPPRDELELAPKLTAEDRALIRLLQENGRASFASLATELGVPERTIRRHVRDLQDQGIMRITTVADARLLGYSVTALVGITVCPGSAPTDVARRLAKQPHAFYVPVVSGRYSVLAEITCRDFDHLREIVERDVISADGVAEATVYPYLALPYQNPSFVQSREKAEGERATPTTRVRIDDTDRRIIAMLYEDGRRPFIQIAAELDISESQVRQRLKRLVDAGAVRVMALTSPQGMGFDATAIIAIRLMPGAEALETAERLAALPAVIYVALPAGDFDIFAEVVCTDTQDMLTLLDKQIRRVPGVAETEPWVYLELHYRPVTPAEAIARLASR